MSQSSPSNSVVLPVTDPLLCWSQSFLQGGLTSLKSLSRRQLLPLPHPLPPQPSFSLPFSPPSLTTFFPPSLPPQCLPPPLYWHQVSALSFSTHEIPEEIPVPWGPLFQSSERHKKRMGVFIPGRMAMAPPHPAQSCVQCSQIGHFVSTKRPSLLFMSVSDSCILRQLKYF